MSSRRLDVINTGAPLAAFFPASDPEVVPFIDYLLSPDPNPYDFIETTPDDNGYGGHFDHYPPTTEAIITGILIESNGTRASYSVTGENLVPEPGTWLLAMVGWDCVLSRAF